MSHGSPELAPAMPEPVEVSLNATEELRGRMALMHEGLELPLRRLACLVLFGSTGRNVRRRFDTGPGGLIINYNDDFAAYRLSVMGMGTAGLFDGEMMVYFCLVEVLAVARYED